MSHAVKELGIFARNVTTDQRLLRTVLQGPEVRTGDIDTRKPRFSQKSLQLKKWVGMCMGECSGGRFFLHSFQIWKKKQQT